MKVRDLLVYPILIFSYNEWVFEQSQIMTGKRNELSGLPGISEISLDGRISIAGSLHLNMRLERNQIIVIL